MIEETTEHAPEQSEQGHRRGRKRLPRGRVTVFPNWCKGCNLCVEFCPMGVLEQGDDGRVIVSHPETCTACRWCELHCPDFAIFVSDIGPASQAGKRQPLGDRQHTEASEEETA